MKKAKRIIAAILTVAAAVSMMTVSAAAVDLDFPAARTVINEIPSAAESTAAAAMTHAPEQVVVENEAGSGMFYNTPIPTTPAPAPVPKDGVPTGAVAAPIAAVAIAAVAGAVAVAARKRRTKNNANDR